MTLSERLKFLYEKENWLETTTELVNNEHQIHWEDDSDEKLEVLYGHHLPEGFDLAIRATSLASDITVITVRFYSKRKNVAMIYLECANGI